MKAIQLTSRLRYYPLSDENGSFGLFVVTSEDGSRIQYTIQVETEDELRAAIESYQDSPVGNFL